MWRATTAASLASVGASVWLLVAPASAIEQQFGVFALGALLCVEGLPFVALLRVRRAFPAWLGGVIGAAAVASVIAGSVLPLAFVLMGLGAELRRRASVDAPGIEVAETIAAAVSTLGFIAALHFKVPLTSITVVAAVALLAAAALSFPSKTVPIVPGPTLTEALRIPAMRHVVLSNLAMNTFFHLRMAATIHFVLTAGPGLAALAWSYVAALIAIAVISVVPLLRGRAGWAVGPLIEGAATLALAVLVLRHELNVTALIAIEVFRHLGMAWYARKQADWRHRAAIPPATTSPFLAAAWGVSPFAGFVGVSLAWAFGSAAPMFLSGVGFLGLGLFLLKAPPLAWQWTSRA